MRFIERNRDRPFLLYLSYYAVHGPVQAKEGLIEAYGERTDPSGRNNAVYAAMVEGVDRSVGRLASTLGELGLASNTAVIFFSDNGGVPQRAFNGGFRAGKGYLWEGGIREPLIVKWPGVTPGGSVESTPVSSVDLYPTILDLADVPDAPGHTVDGVSLAPLLRGAGALPARALYWHYPHYSNSGSTPSGAIRKGSWKLLEFFEDSHTELYDLSDDPAEARDVAPERSALAAELQRELADWRQAVKAQSLTPNPGFAPARARTRFGLRYKQVWDPEEPWEPVP